ncbi:MAG: hypothetical protein ACREHD_26070 [Pirellulales bacterium]
MPAQLKARLNKPRADGNWYLDVKAKGRWEGIIVVDGQGIVIGIYAGREITQWNLPFLPEQIEDVRAASLINRLLASVPARAWFWLPPVSLAVASGLMAAHQILMAAAAVMVGMMPVVRFPRAYCLTGCPMLVAAAGIFLINALLAAKSWLR